MKLLETFYGDYVNVDAIKAVKCSGKGNRIYLDLNLDGSFLLIEIPEYADGNKFSQCVAKMIAGISQIVTTNDDFKTTVYAMYQALTGTVITRQTK